MEMIFVKTQTGFLSPTVARKIKGPSHQHCLAGSNTTEVKGSLDLDKPVGVRLFHGIFFNEDSLQYQFQGINVTVVTYS